MPARLKNGTCAEVLTLLLLLLPTPLHAYVFGDRVQAVQAVNVRNVPAGSAITQRFIGDLGTITDGPVTATLGNTSYVWYQVDWDTGLDGWSFTGGLGAAPTTPLALLYGIDVSRWQTSIDWPAVYAEGKRFAFCKATESSGIVDPWFAVNAVNSRAAGVVTGFYHFARPTENDPLTEARHFYRTTAPALLAGNLVPVLDLENGDTLGRTALSAWARAWLNEVERLTLVRPIIYINRNYAANYMTPDLAAWPLWIAVPGFGAGAPVSGIGAWSNWTFQQYSWTGRLNGIGGGTVDTDLDAFRGTLTDLAAWQIPAISQAITSVSASPAAASAGATIQIQVGTTASHARAVLVSATLFPAGTGTSGLRDAAGEGPVSLPAGPGSLTRSFALPLTLAPGSYDLKISLLMDLNGDGLADNGDPALTTTFTQLNVLTVNAPPAGFATWAGLQGLAGPGAAAGEDPDRDGSDNLMEYAFNTQPRDATSRPLTPLTFQPNGSLVLQFERPQARPDLLWTIQQSDGMTGWSARATAAGDAPFTDPDISQTGSDPWQVRLAVPPGVNGPRFWRVKVQRQAN